MTARERTLATGFAGILLAGGVLLSAIHLKQWKQRVDDLEYDLEMRQTEAEILLGEKDLWVNRAAWIQNRQPVFKTQRDSDAELLLLVQDSAEARGIDIIQNQVQTTKATLPGQQASTITVQGRSDFPSAMGWLYDLQQPGSFVSIPSISISPNEEETSQVNIAFVLQKWYRLPEEK
jgi:hypothetical protein